MRIMCLAVPLCIREIDGLVARCEARGLVRTVSLFLLQHESLAVGDFVLVHLDSAVRRIDRAEAAAAWAAYDEIFAAAGVSAGGPVHTQSSSASPAAA
jgi:hydrogenase expression/formation protein HypC